MHPEIERKFGAERVAHKIMMDQYRMPQWEVIEHPILSKQAIIDGKKIYVPNMYTFLIGTFGPTKEIIEHCCNFAKRKVHKYIDNMYITISINIKQ